MRIEFVASFSPIVEDAGSARAFYAETLGIPFEGAQGGYGFTEELGDGARPSRDRSAPTACSLPSATHLTCAISAP